MFAVCLRYSKSKEEAEDTLHEGFMKVFENIQNLKMEGSLEGWIRRIMVNTSIRKFQRNSNQASVIHIEDYKAHLNHFYSGDVDSNIEAKELILLIQKLPPKCQMVFNLYVFEGLKHKEIAEKLSITEGTSKSNLSDARTILQRLVNRNMRILKQEADGNRE